MSLCLDDRVAVAHAAMGRSVMAINPRAFDEAAGKHKDYRYVGVKDTAALSEVASRFRSDPDWLFLTVDRMSDLGRSVDTELVNPLTYRPMTGSTSGGAINVLKGINDVCIGTDGGGSVLAPALATNLYALMGKGLGLVAGGGVSTDGLGFAAGVGFIGRSLELVTQAAELACGEGLFSPLSKESAGGCVLLPASGCAFLPDGRDMREALAPYAGQLSGDWHLDEFTYSSIYDREQTVWELRDIWAEHSDACVVSYEGPVDVYAADETIARTFCGAAPEVVAGVRSKALCKAVNIAGGTGICIPSCELACGFVVACGPGVAAARRALWLARELEAARGPLPAPLVRYFLDRSKPYRPLM